MPLSLRNPSDGATLWLEASGARIWRDIPLAQRLPEVAEASHGPNYGPNPVVRGVRGSKGQGPKESIVYVLRWTIRPHNPPAVKKNSSRKGKINN